MSRQAGLLTIKMDPFMCMLKCARWVGLTHKHICLLLILLYIYIYYSANYVYEIILLE